MSDSHITVTSFFLIPAETRCVCETLCTPTTYIWPLYLTFDLDGWPWPFTTQNVQLHEVHMHAKYQIAIFNIAKFDLWPWTLTLKDDFDHDLIPLKMCSSMRYTCMPNIKLLSLILHKLWLMSRFDANKQTNEQTNRQGKHNMSPSIVWGT